MMLGEQGIVKTIKRSRLDTRNYTVSGKKCDTLFSTITHATLGRFYNFIPLETGMNNPQSHVIYFLNGLMTS